MKRIILFLSLVILSASGKAQGITAANGTVVVKQGTVSVTGGITGTFVASGTGTTVISGTPTVALTQGLRDSINIIAQRLYDNTYGSVAYELNQIYVTEYSSNNLLSSIYYSGVINVSKKLDTLLQIARTRTLAVSASSVTSSGTVSAGAKSIIMIFSTDFVGTVNGIAADPGSAIGFSATRPDVLGAIPYAITAGSIRIRRED